MLIMNAQNGSSFDKQEKKVMKKLLRLVIINKERKRIN